MDERNFIWRLSAIKLCVTLFFFAIIFKLFTFVNFGNHETPAPIISPIKDGAIQHQIFDRNQHLVASSIITYSLYADPAEILDATETAEALHAYFPDINAAQLREKLSSNLRFIWIKRNLTPKQFQDIHNFGLPGLFAKKEFKRIYPTGNLLSHIIGFKDTDGQGLKGIERSIDQLDDLKNQAGITLSIDVGVQNIIRQELIKGVKEFDAIGGSAILMDANTGEIVSMISVPDFNPHDLNHVKADQLFNKAYQGSYELGSTYKILNLAIGLDTQAVSLQDKFDATHPIMIGKFKVDDYFAQKRILTVPEILVHSSNIGSVKIAQKIGIERQQDYLRKMGMLYPSMIELPEKATPLTPSTWREANMMTIAYGYGLAVSPLHLTAAVASIVNGGVFYPPTILKKDEDETLYGERILSEDTAYAIRDLLYQSTASGKSKTARVDGYFVGGKSGTGLKAGVQSYKQDKRISSFVGAFPIYDPKYVLYIMIDEPKGNKNSYGYATGGWVSAPVAGHVISKIAPMLNIKPQPESDDHFKKLLDAHTKKNHPINTSYRS